MNAVANQKTMKNDPGLVASKMFADVFQAYLECSDEVQAAIRDMVKIVNAPDATPEEQEAALGTIAEALFPSKHNGVLGVCLDDCEKDAPKDVKAILKQMNHQETTFGERVNALLEAKSMTQADLAAVIEIGQPAVSMLLSRSCRPQRRTVEKIAKALKVAPEDIWPGYNEE
jgi:predicted XRE-type DNA-binding protein